MIGTKRTIHKTINQNKITIYSKNENISLHTRIQQQQQKPNQTQLQNILNIFNELPFSFHLSYYIKQTLYTKQTLFKRSMATLIHTISMLCTPPLDVAHTNRSLTQKQKKVSSLKKTQKTWVVTTQSAKSKIICMSRQAIHKEFLDMNFKKDEDIIRLAPLIFKEPLLVNFDYIINYQVFSALQTRTIYSNSLKLQVQDLFLGKSSNIIVLGPVPSHNQLCSELVSILCRHIIDVLKVQSNTIHKLGVSIQSIISNSISMDLLEQQTVTSFQTINGKPLSIVRIKHIQQLGSILYLSNKNRQKRNKLIGEKSRKQSSMVYKIMLKAGESTFSEISIYSPCNIKNTNKRQINGLLQYIDNVHGNTKQYLDHQDNLIIRNLINEKTISPSSITLIYNLINDSKHLEQNLITLALADHINQQTQKKQYFQPYSFDKSNNKSYPQVQFSNKRLNFNTSSFKKLGQTERQNSSSRTKMNSMSDQLQNKVANLQYKLKQLSAKHQKEIQKHICDRKVCEVQYKEQIENYQSKIQLLIKKLQKSNRQSSNSSRKSSISKQSAENVLQFKQRMTVLQQENLALTQRCEKLEVVLQSKSKLEAKLESVKKERNQLKQTVKKMNQQIYQLIRDQQIDINKLKKS